jgi:hypothetical protein
MKRITAVGAALLLLLLAVGASALAAPSNHHDQHVVLADASQKPDTNEETPTDDSDPQDATGSPSPANLDRIVERLDNAGVTTDSETLADLAARYGVGGAVRLLAWAEASGQSVDDLAAMFDSGMGWGEIARQLNGEDDSLSLHPGIGWIMGNGHSKDHGPSDRPGNAPGHAGAPGQQ